MILYFQMHPSIICNDNVSRRMSGPCMCTQNSPTPLHFWHVDLVIRQVRNLNLPFHDFYSHLFGKQQIPFISFTYFFSFFSAKYSFVPITFGLSEIRLAATPQQAHKSSLHRLKERETNLWCNCA